LIPLVEKKERKIKKNKSATEIQVNLGLISALAMAENQPINPRRASTTKPKSNPQPSLTKRKTEGAPTLAPAVTSKIARSATQSCPTKQQSLRSAEPHNLEGDLVEAIIKELQADGSENE